MRDTEWPFETSPLVNAQPGSSEWAGATILGNWCQPLLESHVSEFVDRAIAGLTALEEAPPSWRSFAAGSSAGMRSARSSSSSTCVLRKATPLRSYQRKREALQALAEGRERHHKAELAALDGQVQAKLEALTRANEALTWDRMLCRSRKLSLCTVG